jgi:hypothetical protein
MAGAQKLPGKPKPGPINHEGFLFNLVNPE